MKAKVRVTREALATKSFATTRTPTYVDTALERATTPSSFFPDPPLRQKYGECQGPLGTGLASRAMATASFLL